MDLEDVFCVSAVDISTAQTSEATGGSFRLVRPPPILNVGGTAATLCPIFPIANIHGRDPQFVNPLDYMCPSLPVLPSSIMVRNFLRLNLAERSDLTQSTGFRCVQSAQSTLEGFIGFRYYHAVVISDASQDPTCASPPGVDISRDWYL